MHTAHARVRVALERQWLACAEMGLQTFIDLLEFIGSLILSEGEGMHNGLDIFGLALLQAALNSGAQALERSVKTLNISLPNLEVAK